MMKLKDSRQLEFYENHFHKKGYDATNCPEYLKNIQKKYVKLSVFSKSYKLLCILL